MAMIEVEFSDYEDPTLYVHGSLKIKAYRAHPKIKNAYYYKYRCIMTGGTYHGELVHSPKKGTLSLISKVTKAIVSQQKAERQKSGH